MTSDEYWNGNPYRVRAYYEAHELKRSERNQELWLQGLYFHNALIDALQGFGVGLAGGKGKKPSGYMKEPLPITEQEREYAKQKKIRHTLDWITKGQDNGNN